MSLEQHFALHYEQFPQQYIFAPDRILPHGITPEVYDEVRRGYSSIKAGLTAGAWYRSGCLPLLFMITIVGIPIFMFLQWSEGMMSRRARNAAILAFRAASKGDANYKRYISGNLLSITTEHFDRVF